MAIFSPAVRRLRGEMELFFLGGGSEIGASCTLVEIEGRRLLVDAGIRMGAAAGEHLPNFSLIDDVGTPEEVLITHAHSDHTGGLPALVPGLPWDVPLRCTPPTLAITRILFNDALKIMQFKEEREGDIPLYPPEAVELTLGRMKGVPYLTTVPICDGALKATWIPAGHILGAACIYIEGKRESLLVSGDVSVGDQRTIPGMVIPRCRPDVAVLEATYGNRRHADRAQQEAALVEKVAEVIEAGGKVLIPAFAVGRAQEVILILARAVRQGRMPPFPVWIDGMVRAVNAVYASFPEILAPSLRRRIEKGESPFYTDFIRPVSRARERDQVLDGPPCCIVASSGMLTGGASAFYAARLAGGSENLIAITGYQDEEAPGRALLNLSRAGDRERVLTLNGQRVPVSCRVETYSLSAHADSGELAALARRLEPVSVCLVHGDDEARRSLATALDWQLSGGVHLPDNGGVYRSEGVRKVGTGPRYGGGVSRLGLGGKRRIDEHALEEIRTYLLETEAKGPLRVQDLAEIWCGSEGVSLDEIGIFKELLEGDQRLFEADRKRPYLFWIAKEGEAVEPSGPMEMNQARARIQEVFPEEVGLFRCSVHVEEGVYELAFHFPDIVQARFGEQIRALEEETGWAIRVRETPHQERLFEEALACVPAGVVVVKAPALRLERREVAVGVEAAAHLAESWGALAEDASRRFGEITGYALILARPEEQVAAPSELPGAWEINRAYARIREAFSEEPHAPQKIGRKEEGGGAYIELAFVSPTVGARYEDLLQQLCEQTGWPMRVRQTINQQQIAEEARRFTPDSCGLRGMPKLFTAEGCVVVSVAQLPADEEAPGLEEAFFQATGLRISWQVT
ncbi:MAG: MBL fold metallo-hydrolase [Gemmatimonadetes bacterium]|nr:MBL fold metallo-hydrolase [Gemmatimonadota bacterium]